MVGSFEKSGNALLTLSGDRQAHAKARCCLASVSTHRLAVLYKLGPFSKTKLKLSRGSVAEKEPLLLQLQLPLEALSRDFAKLDKLLVVAQHARCPNTAEAP